LTPTGTNRCVPYEVTEADERALRPFVVPAERVKPSEVAALRAEIEGAGRTERRLHTFLDRHPHLVTAAFVRGGEPRWLFSEKRLHNAFRADLVVGALYSGRSIEWQLIELEPPKTRGIYHAKREFDDRAEEAVNQIRQWRAFIGEHRESLWKPRHRGGATLPGIEASARGWVIVGRSDDFSPEMQRKRERLRDQEHIEVRSWDYVLKVLDERATSTHR